VKLLLAENGIVPYSEDNLGQTPLWWATKNGYESVTELLGPITLDS
jgi:ankyrin repeat protein